MMEEGCGSGCENETVNESVPDETSPWMHFSASRVTEILTVSGFLSVIENTIVNGIDVLWILNDMVKMILNATASESSVDIPALLHAVQIDVFPLQVASAHSQTTP
jgi:hypothetical protein